MLVASVPARPPLMVVSQEIVESSTGSNPPRSSIIAWLYSETAPSSPIEATRSFSGADAWTTTSAAGAADGEAGGTLFVGVGTADGAVPGTGARVAHPTSDSAHMSPATPPSSAFLAMGTHPTHGKCRRQQPREQKHEHSQGVRKTVVPCGVRKAVGL